MSRSFRAGHPIAKLFTASTHTDGAFYVYLEAIDENGKVTYLTEGQLRALQGGALSHITPS